MNDTTSESFRKESLSAVVVAAGGSQRFQRSLQNAKAISSIPNSKQLIIWEDKPLFVHTLLALFNSLELSQVALVCREEDREQFQTWINKTIDKKNARNILIVTGGVRRQDSVRNGLSTLLPSTRVLIHDAARPFLSQEFLHRLYRAALEYEAVIPGIPIVETLKEIDSNGFVEKTWKRESFVRVQTPQFFKYDLIRSIHEKFADSDKEFTDDAAMAESENVSVRVVPGTLENIKVTTVEDLQHLRIGSEYSRIAP